MATRIWLGLACVTVAAVSATACFVREGDDAETMPQQVVEGRESVLGAVVALEGGCTAVKVGPKQLLVAARCVTNRPAYAIGKPLRFRVSTPLVVAAASPDGGAGAGDAGADTDAEATDAGDARDATAAADASDASTGDATTTRADGGAVATADGGSDAGASGGADATGAYETTIAQVHIHPSFLAKCGTGACAAGKTGAVEVADVAVIVLSREIADLTIAPVDLDPVSIGDGVLALGYGCDATADTSTQLRAKATSAVSADAVNHAGSPYDARPDLAREMAKSYVVTRGPGNTAAGASAPGICTERDLGAPIFRSDGTSIVGVSSGTTIAPNTLPMTNQYARVDALARHGVGAWLAQLGVKTTRTCSAPDAGGCPKQPESSESDGGSDAAAPTGEPLPDLTPGSGGEAPNEESSTKDRTPSGDDEPTTTKKKSSENSGCSAAPIGPSSPTSGLALLAAAALALTLRARRQRRA